MLDLRRIDAVLVDAGGVLLLPDPEPLHQFLAPFGAEPNPERVRWAHYASTRAVDRLGRVDWPAIDRVVAAELGVPDEHLDAAVHVIEESYDGRPWVPIAGAAEALRGLEAAGFPLAVVSNASGTMEAQLADHEICSVTGGVSAKVGVVIDSAVVGVEKPDPAIFRLALDTLGVDADRCLYVGDSVYFDVDGARATGMQAAHLDPYCVCAIDGHPHLRDLDDLVVQLGLLEPEA